MPTGQRATPARKATGAKVEPQSTPATSEAEEVNTTTTNDEELTDAQREIAELKDQLAKARGAKDPELEYDKVTNPGDEKNILIHFVRDGFCELGTVWYRGQELELEPGTPQYKSAKAWTDLSADEQEEIYGDVYFRKGEWKGKTYEDKAATEAERRRGRAVPRQTD